MASDMNKDLHELRTEVSSLQSDITNIASTLKRLTGDAVTDAKELSRAKTKETRSSLEHQVKERPLTSAVVAVGIGFVLAKLLGR